MYIYIYIYIYIQAGIKHPCTQNLSNSPTGLYIYIYTKNNEKQVFFAFALRVSPLLRLFRHSKVFLLTYYVTDVIVITIIMALVIRSTREQLA